MTDSINPKHYNAGDVYEHRKVVVAWGLDYETGCATKYICRFGKKESADPVEDLRKAIRYLEFEIDKLKGETYEKETNKKTNRTIEGTQGKNPKARRVHKEAA